MAEGNGSISSNGVFIDVKVASTTQMSNPIGIKVVKFPAFALVYVLNYPHSERIAYIVLKIDDFSELFGYYLEVLLFDPIIQV